MAKEGNLNVSLSVTKRDPTNTFLEIQYNRQCNTQVDVSGASGPYVGTVNATTGGNQVSLAAIPGGTPGLCFITNQDPTNSVLVGTWDSLTHNFSPFLMLKPGMGVGIYLAPSLHEYVGGTPGTGSAGVDQLWVKALVAACAVLFEVFPE